MDFFSSLPSKLNSNKHGGFVCCERFKQCAETLMNENGESTHFPTQKTLSEIHQAMGLSKVAAADLEAVCSPSSFFCNNEKFVQNWDNPMDCPKNVNLQTLEERIKTLKHMSTAEARKKGCVKSRFTDLDCASQGQFEGVLPIDKEDAVSLDEVVLKIRVSYPRTARRFKHFYFDFECLGSQLLHELRDVICCPIDEQNVTVDNSTKKLKTICTSGFFYIEGKIYSDFRRSTDHDLSVNIKEWVKTAKTDLPANIESCCMNNIALRELTIQLGKRYAYLHQGDCEHEITFISLRLHGPTDCQSSSKYPICVTRPRIKSIACKVCGTRSATWVTYEDELSDENPSFFCEQCYYCLHFSEDRSKKLGNFNSMPFVNLVSLGP